MTLSQIAANSQYLTDNRISNTNLVSIGNQCIAEINTKVGTNLPLFVADNLSTTDYDAVADKWLLRLIEPYVSYSIMANDNDNNLMTYNYNRFLDAVSDFKKMGLKDIKLLDDEDVATGYEGTSKRSVKIDTSARTVTYLGGDW